MKGIQYCDLSSTISDISNATATGSSCMVSCSQSSFSNMFTCGEFDELALVP